MTTQKRDDETPTAYAVRQVKAEGAREALDALCERYLTEAAAMTDAASKAEPGSVEAIASFARADTWTQAARIAHETMKDMR